MTYSRYSPGKYCLFLDWETSGADFNLSYSEQFVPEMFQGIQLGMVIADTENFEEVDAIRVNIKFDPTYKWQDEAQKIHGLTREFLEEHGVYAEEAVVTIIEFITKHFGNDVIYYGDGVLNKTRTICFGGHNLGFDIAALQALLKRFDFAVAEHHVRLETSSIGFLAVGIYKSTQLFEYFGAEKRGDHDALDDARQSLAVVTGVKSLIKSALGA